MNESYNIISDYEMIGTYPVTSPEDVVDVNSVSHETREGMEKLRVIYQMGSMFAEINPENN